MRQWMPSRLKNGRAVSFRTAQARSTPSESASMRSGIRTWTAKFPCGQNPRMAMRPIQARSASPPASQGNRAGAIMRTTQGAER
jgi:hypothetical protein